MKEARQLLENAKHLSDEIKQIEMQIKTLEYGQLPSGIRYDKDKVKSSPSNAMEEFGWLIIELENQMSNAKSNLVKTTILINETIETMPTSVHRQLIRLRYLNGYDWWRVGNEIGYSEFHTRTDIHSKALKEFTDTYKQARSSTTGV